MKPLRSCLLGSSALFVALTLSASAAGVWDGGDPSASTWNTPLNWDSDAVPISPLALTFDGTTRLANTNDLTAFTANGITFNSGAGEFVIDGNAVTLGGAVTNNSTSKQTLGLGLTLNAGRNINAASGDVAITGPVTGTTFILSKTGTGKLTLSGTGGVAQLSIGNGNAGGAAELSGGAWTQTGTITGIGLIVGNGVGSGTFTVSGGTHTFGGDDYNNAVRIGTATGGAQSTPSTLNITGGLMKVGTTGALNASMNLGTAMNSGTSNGALSISGGELQIGGRLLVGSNSITNTAAVTVSGTGVLNMTRTGTVDPGLIRIGSGISNFNFNGGTVIATGIYSGDHTSTTVASNVFYNGSEIRANFSGGAFGTAGATTKFYVEAGGLKFNSNGFDATIPAPLLNSLGTTGELTKTGAGTLSLTAVNTFNGQINVNGGTLALTTGTVPATTPFTIGSAGNLRLDTPLTRTVKSVTMADGATWSGLACVTVGSPRTTVTDALTFGGTTATFVIAALPVTAAPIVGDVYDVIQAGSIFGTPALTADLSVTRFTGTAAVSGNKIQVTLTGGATAGLVWNNATANGTWNLNTSANFLNGASNDVFKQYDSVTFNDSIGAGAKAVTLTGTLLPSSVLVDVTNTNYTFTGTISGAGALLKKGSGTLALSSAQAYTGGTTVEGGTMTAAAMGVGPITVTNSGSVFRFTSNDPFGQAATTPTQVITATNGGVITNSTNNFLSVGPVVLNNGTLTSAGGNSANYQSFKINGPVTVTGNSTIGTSGGTNNQIHLGGHVANAMTTFNVVGSTDTLTVSAVLRNLVTGVSGTGAASGITKSGAGTMIISAAPVYTGNTVVNEGTLTLQTASLPDAADVRLASTGAILNLTHAATDVIDELYIDGFQQAAGTWGSLTSTATHKTKLITGTGILQVTTGGTDTPYSLWATSKGLFGNNADGSLDPDHDGFSNVGEFALNSDPLAAGTGGKVVTKVVTLGSAKVLTLTLPVRTGTTFYPAGGQLVTDATETFFYQTGPVIKTFFYQIQGSTDLETFEVEVSELTEPADIAAVQGTIATDRPLDAGWSYRSFRTTGNVATVPKQFMRAIISLAP